MSQRQTINSVTGLGVKEYDLSESRSNQLIRLPAASTFIVMQCPDAAYLSIGDEDTRGLDLRDIKQYTTPDGGPIGQVYLSNPAGSGTLRVLFGHAGDVRTDDNVVVEDIDSISADVNVSDRAAREIGKARMQNSGGTLIDPAENLNGATSTAAAAGTGSANAAEINVPDGRESVTVMYNTSGAASITVEVSADGATWYPLTSYAPGSASTNADSITVGADYVRAYIDANLNSLEVSAKGV